MNDSSSRRRFLGAGLALPVLGSASTRLSETAPALAAPRSPALPKFSYGTLGRTGLKVTRVAFGCMVTSDPSVIEKAADMGVNYFDTARVYQSGNNERMVGAALKKYRDKVYISSKTVAGTKQQALEHLETSLRELQTDHLDIWYLHSKSTAAAITDELMEAQLEAKKAGKIRFTGVSFHKGHAEVMPAALKTNHFDVFLLSYNFTMDKASEALIEQARKAGVGIVGMKVFAGGLRRTSFYPITDETHAKLQKEGAMLAALKWVLRNPHVDTTIPSITDMDQLDEDLRAMAEPFGEAERKTLAELRDYNRPVYCRMCNQCEGTCAQGLPVPDVLRPLMYAEGYGQFAVGREHYRELPERVAQIRCGDCAECTVRCPVGVRVRERLTRAQELFV